MEESSPASDLDWVLGKLAAVKLPTSKLAPPPPATFDPSKFTIQPLGDPASKTKKPDRKKEIDLWHHWNNNGRQPEHLEPLLTSFKPLIQARINKFQNRVEIPNSAIEMEHKKAFVKALKDYDPSRGAQLHSYVTQQLKQVGRYVGTRQNVARITDNILRHIGSFNAAKSELTERLGYEPDAQEIHDFIIETNHPKLAKLSLKNITRLNQEQYKSHIDKGHDTTGIEDLSRREEEIAYLIIPQLTPAERKVHELTLGLNGQKKHTPGEIAKKLNFDNSKVSKLRKSIYKKIEPHLEG